MKVLITPTSFRKPQNSKAREAVETYVDEVVYNPYDRSLKADEITGLLEGVGGYIAGLDYIDEEVIEKAPASLKVISRYGAGTDRVDIPAASRKGIIVTNTPGTNAIAVAELAVALMLSLARSIPKMDSAVKRGEWPRKNGLELSGKTLGIVGLGAIGRNVAARARAFGMNVTAYDPYIDEAYVKTQGIASLPLDKLLAGSDFISLHVPLNDDTKHMIGRERLGSLKDGAFIINTARGGLINETAAAEALRSGKLGGLGLDAYEVEPVTDSPLIDLDNVVMTPHMGAHTNEAVAAMGNMAVKNLIDVLEGRDCPYIVK
ncbi:MAG: phosphoglycerate dehydrogenase [Eubacteriales bacterium]|nr:phosphoglycerate dehydrogenase [Eubacteriales bacterium]